MKKIVLILILFVPIFIKASITDVFIDSEVDISGNLIIREIVNINDKNDVIKIYYENNLNDKLYLSSGIKINRIGIYNGQDSNGNYIIEDTKYSHVEKDGYYNIKFDDIGKYYIEYIVLNVCVKHKDSSELYYRYFNKVDSDINNITILTKLPDYSKLFDIHTYKYKPKRIKDNNYYIINKIDKLKKGNSFDLRILYDKELFSININKDKITNFNMYKTLNNNRYIFYNIILIIIFLIILVLLLILDSHNKIDVTRYNIKSKKIDKNIKIIFLSDLHNRDISYKIKNIIDKEKPDIVLYGGDMVNESINKIDNFIKLDSLVNYKKYYIYGNHECRMNEEDYEKYNKIIDDLKINKLFNKKNKLSRNINLIGFVSDYEKYKKFHKLTLNKKYILDKIGKLDTKKFNILVAHNPLEFDSYVDVDVDLVLSGHVHGGEIKLPLIGGLFSPDYTFFPKYSEGLYEKNNTKMIVSRGLGFSERLPIRILNPAEIVVINLMKDE